MKKKLAVIVGVMFVLLLAAAAVLAQGGLQYLSAYQVQNLEGSEATVVVSYYKQSDGALQASGTFTIAASSVKTVFPFTSGPFGDNITGVTTFNGSAVLSSD